MKIDIEGSELVIRVNLDVRGANSKSGKSHILGSTEGFTNLATPFGTAKIGLNVITTDENWTGGGRESHKAGNGSVSVNAPKLVKPGQAVS